MIIQIPKHNIKPLLQKPSDNEIQWHIKNNDFRINEIWEKGALGQCVKIGILDTGIIETHEDINSENIIDKKDFTGSRLDWIDEDPNRHGTRIAGFIGASKNGKGIVGVAPQAKLYIGKVMRGTDPPSIEALLAGLKWCINRWDVDIINLSLAYSNCSDQIHIILKEAVKRNKIIICGSGNRLSTSNDEYEGTLDYPAAYQETISVGAIDARNEIFSANSQGTLLDLVAPGKNIVSTSENPKYEEVQGSSFSAAYVSGVCALLISGTKSTIWNQLKMKNLLIKTSLDLSDKDPNGMKYGFGLVRPNNAYKKILNQ